MEKCPINKRYHSFDTEGGVCVACKRKEEELCVCGRKLEFSMQLHKDSNNFMRDAGGNCILSGWYCPVCDYYNKKLFVVRRIENYITNLSYDVIMGTKSEWEQIRNFFRQHVDQGFKNPLNTIRLSKANTKEHNLRVAEVCITLLEKDIPFYTEVKLKCGLRPDIVCPTHVVKCIEVMHTETKKDFEVKKSSKIPKELEGEFLFVDAKKQFEPEDVL